MDRVWWTTFVLLVLDGQTISWSMESTLPVESSVAEWQVDDGNEWHQACRSSSKPKEKGPESSEMSDSYLIEDFFRIVSQSTGRVSVTLSRLLDLKGAMQLEDLTLIRTNLPDREHRDDLARAQRSYSDACEDFEGWILQKLSLSSTAPLRSSRTPGVHVENEYSPYAEKISNCNTDDH